MTLLKQLSHPYVFYVIPIFSWATLIICYFIYISGLNNGFFTYTLDDAYIHLSLAQNIAQGHYGINAGEFSSPSSSILWPLILAPFAYFDFFYLLPLFINSLCVFAVLLTVQHILFVYFLERPKTYSGTLLTLVLTVFIVAVFGTNSLVFTGMEHSLQLLLTCLILLGILRFEQNGVLHNWLIAAVVIAPLVRYENLALSGLVIFYFLFYKHYFRAFICFVLLAIVIAGFSLFLHSLGLPLLPASILRKLANFSLGNYPQDIAFIRNISYFPNGIILFIFSSILLYACIKTQRLIFGIFGLACIIHLAFGNLGWSRYEYYLLTPSFLLLILFFKSSLHNYLKSSYSLLNISTLFICCILYFFNYWYYSFVSLPNFAHHVYLQHYQMHKFINHIYKDDVAVNDIGYVSLDSPYYILDLYGLSSSKAREMIMLANKGHVFETDWMDQLVKSHDIKLAIIIKSWFQNYIPKTWVELVAINSNRVPGSYFSFYATDVSFVSNLCLKLSKFQTTLPPGIEYRKLGCT